MDCCTRDGCFHSYGIHHPGAMSDARLAGLRGKTGKCRVPGCRCSGYIKGQRSAPRNAPDLCPRCIKGDHGHHTGRKCLSWVAPIPRDHVCLCEVDREVGEDNPIALECLKVRRPSARELVEAVIELEEARNA